MPGGTLQVSGLKELDAALRQLERKTAKKYVGKALREGAKVVQKAAKANAPKKTGALRKSIKVRAKKKKAKGQVAFLVSTSATDNAFQGDQFYGGFLEFGWKQGKRPGKAKKAILGDNRKQHEGRHFMERAFESAGEAAVATFKTKIWELIRGEAKK